MDWHKLLFLISVEFIESTQGIPFAQWQVQVQPTTKYIISESEFITAKLMHLLYLKKKVHLLSEMSVHKTPITIIWNWSLLYANKLDLKTSFERFIAFAEKNGYKDILRIPDYAKALRMSFEYIYSYVASLQLSDDDIYTPANSKVSFVKSWIANIMHGTPNLTIERAYVLFLEKSRLVNQPFEIDGYFKSCFIDVEQTYESM